MRDFTSDTHWLSINTATLPQWSLDQLIRECANNGIRAVAPWRDKVRSLGIGKVATLLSETGVQLSGYCRGGMFTGATAAERRAAREDNRRCVDEAKALNAPCLILVVGGLQVSASDPAACRDLGMARSLVYDGIADLLEYAQEIGMPVAIEPLHPMYAADRSCINTLEQALDLCEALDPLRTGSLGVAVDVYHVWWDPKLKEQIFRAGATRLLAFHVSDWLVPTQDLLLDRGLMGDGVIDIRGIRRWVEEAGYEGFSEVEIFSTKWASRRGQDVLHACIARHRSSV